MGRLLTVLFCLVSTAVSAQPIALTDRVERVNSRYVTTVHGDSIIESVVVLRGGSTLLVPGGRVGDVFMQTSEHDLLSSGDVATFIIEQRGRSAKTVRMGSDAYLARPYRWPGATVSYYVNPTNLDMSSSAAITAIGQAAQNWFTQADISLQMVYAGTITGGTLSKNLRNEIFFRNESNGSVIAEVYWWYNSRSEFIDADMVFYDTRRFFPGSTGCSSGYYLEDIATHEFGHWYGLGHSTVSGATMWPSAATCSTNTRTLASDDIIGVESMYGVEGPDPDPTGETGTLTLKKMEVRLTLAWTGLVGTSVDVYLNGVKKWTTANDGVQVFTVSPAPSWAFKVCSAGTTTCAAATITY